MNLQAWRRRPDHCNTTGPSTSAANSLCEILTQVAPGLPVSYVLVGAIFIFLVLGLMLIPTPELRPTRCSSPNRFHAAGYEKRMIRTIQDSNGRPVFELFRFERATFE
jgi:hypothetical protein